MNRSIKYKSGDRFGVSILTGKSFMKGPGRRFMECLCQCGNIFYTMYQSLRTGSAVSCGCKNRETQRIRMTKHGEAGNFGRHLLYAVWQGIKSRCYYNKAERYDRYGGRGITVCNEWKDNFIPFKKWAIENGWEEGLSIERNDNDGNYEPSNCRFATDDEQSVNKSTNVFITAFGETKVITYWLKDQRCVVSPTTAYHRMNVLGWPFERAITEPPKTKNRKWQAQQLLTVQT